MSNTAAKQTKQDFRNNSGELNFNIQRHLGVLSTSKSGWTKEVNLVSWNDRPGKLDIRDWNPEHEKMGKGLTLNGSEVAYLTDILKDFDIAEAGI